MKLFVSYAFTGENEMAVRARLERLRGTLTVRGVESYINIYDPLYQSLVYNHATAMEYLQIALTGMEDCDTVLVLMTSERRSEGMLMEVGAAIARQKKIILAQHASSVGKTYLNTVADKTFIWHSEDELTEKISQVILSQ